MKIVTARVITLSIRWQSIYGTGETNPSTARDIVSVVWAFVQQNVCLCVGYCCFGTRIVPLCWFSSVSIHMFIIVFVPCANIFISAGNLALYNLILPTISLEMPVPSQGDYGFHSFPVVDWFCLFIYLRVLTFPLEDCSEFVILLLPLFVKNLIRLGNFAFALS